EDDEFGWLDRSDADIDEKLARIAGDRWVVLLVALDEERLFGGGAEKRTRHPVALEEGADVAPHLRPKHLIVGLEHGPLRPVVDRLLDVVEQPANVEVAPGRVAGERAGAPDADAASRESANAVHADGVQDTLFGRGEL